MLRTNKDESCYFLNSLSNFSIRNIFMMRLICTEIESKLRSRCITVCKEYDIVRHNAAAPLSERCSRRDDVCNLLFICDRALMHECRTSILSDLEYCSCTSCKDSIVSAA